VEALAKLRLARTEGVGPLTYRRLLAQFGSAEAALGALPEVADAAGRKGLVIYPAGAAEREMATLRKHRGRMLFLGDKNYPALLGLLADPPPMLSVFGDVAVLSARAVGVVGARNASANGQRMAEALATDLAAAGLCVVSGMARGVDAAAHTGAMHVGRTVAVVAGALDHPYPPEHAALQARIAEQGAVVTEAPWGTAAQSRHFPRRNRIIAGLCMGLVVVEAALRSGSLITARLAQEAGREIFAVPGSPLDPRCRGCNDLIKQGARLVESAADVVAELPEYPGAEGLGRLPLFARGAGRGFAEQPAVYTGPEANLAQVCAEVVELLGASPTEIDVVVRRSQFAPAAVMAALSQLELALKVEVLPGSRVALLSG
jgi:DNA processing protein